MMMVGMMMVGMMMLGVMMMLMLIVTPFPSTNTIRLTSCPHVEKRASQISSLLRMMTLMMKMTTLIGIYEVLR